MIHTELRARLARAFRPLDRLPDEEPPNLVELIDMLPSPALRPAAVLVPLRLYPDSASVLLTRRTDDLPTHPGQVSFPGGRIEQSDADPIAAALRETHEEIGIAPDAVTALGYLDPYATITGYRVTPVVALVDATAETRHDPREVAEVFEVPLDFLLDPANCQRREGEFRGRLRHYYVYPWKHYQIWGATAAMLRDFAAKLNAA